MTHCHAVRIMFTVPGAYSGDLVSLRQAGGREMP